MAAADPASRPAEAKPLVAALSMVVLTVAVLQTGIVPVLDVIAEQLRATTVSVSWAVTANLLAAAAATPLIGRLADTRTKKRVLLAVLGLVLAGSLLGAVASSVPMLVLARVLQGTSFALYPIAVSILRDELPAERLIRSMAMLSAMLGFGGGLGLVVTGLLMTDGASFHRVFWLGAAITVAATAAAVRFVPSRPDRLATPIDWAGAAGLAAGLSALLLALTQGRVWGWTSPWTTAVAAAGAALLYAWWRWSRRCPHPLISTALLVHRPILLTNLATLMVGMGLYFSFLGLTDFVEAMLDTGHGFGASVLEASVVFLLPGALAAAFTALISGRLIERFGARAVIMAGSALGVIGFGMLIGWHSSRWEVIVAGLLTNAYISLAYGAIPTLIVQEVDESQTGVATGMNAIVRTVGGAVAAALVAVLLTAPRGGQATESAFIGVFALGAATAALSILLVGLTPKRIRSGREGSSPAAR